MVGAGGPTPTGGPSASSYVFTWHRRLRVAGSPHGLRQVESRPGLRMTPYGPVMVLAGPHSRRSAVTRRLSLCPRPQAFLRRAAARPASQPGVRPRGSGRRASVGGPARAVSRAVMEFEFHLSPMLSSSRPRQTWGTVCELRVTGSLRAKRAAPLGFSPARPQRCGAGNCGHGRRLGWRRAYGRGGVPRARRASCSGATTRLCRHRERGRSTRLGDRVQHARSARQVNETRLLA
jgi:hypothetical protein